MAEPLSKSEIAKTIRHKSISQKPNDKIQEPLSEDLIERTLPDKPTSRLLKYRLTAKGGATTDPNPERSHFSVMFPGPHYSSTLPHKLLFGIDPASIRPNHQRIDSIENPQSVMQP